MDFTWSDEQEVFHRRFSLEPQRCSAALERARLDYESL